jgi:hypothetical protein
VNPNPTADVNPGPAIPTRSLTRRGTAGGLATLALMACTPMSPRQIETPADGGLSSGPEVAADAAGSQAMQQMLERIRADAATRAGVAPDEVRILTVESVTWADGSLGCPAPGMMYTQALVRGYRVRVEAAGTGLLYHASARHDFVQCPLERAREPAAIEPA